ncbi:MAG TPA: hypothetical protein PLS56_00125 [Candidatus Dojkabacteria bacterium]|nr:hypothetical protein [Candidatus Dojkabacteria bacterium]
MEKESINTVEYIKIVKEAPEKRKGYGFFAVTLIASILLIVFAIRPTILTITRIKKEIKGKEIMNSQLDTKITTLSSLDKIYLENKESFDSLKLIFPADGNFSLFLSNVDSIVARNGFALTGIIFDDYKGETYKASSTSVLKPKTARVTVSGKVVNIVNLLKDFEALPMYPVVETLSFTNHEDDNGMITFSIGLRVYAIDNNNFYKE